MESSNTDTQLLDTAEAAIFQYLEKGLNEDRIDRASFKQAVDNTSRNLRTWLTDPVISELSPHLQPALRKAINDGQWETLVNAFRRPVSFGTGGIRGMMAFDRDSIEKIKHDGLDAPIIKGPNTINEIVLLLASAGVAKYGRSQDPQFKKVVVGYDSRIRGFDFAEVVAKLFLANDYTVYFFDEPGPYPEATFATPYPDIRSDLGILISASHNDYRYNGYKLSCGNGSQFDPHERDEMYDTFIATATTKDIQLCEFKDAPPGKLIFLGGNEPLDDFDYHGCELINMHAKHREHVKSFLLTDRLPEKQAESPDPLKIAFCAFHGAGRRAVPRLLNEVGFLDVKVITARGLNDLDGMFPSFDNTPGQEKQPDPGDERAAKTAVAAFEEQYGSFDQVDILIGTDPDADRCGVVVKVPEDQRSVYDGEDWALLPADEIWALIIWFRLFKEAEASGEVQDAEKKFVVLSHTTSDSIAFLARRHGLGVGKTWVGFAALAAGVRDVWEAAEGNGVTERMKALETLNDGRQNVQEELCDDFVCEYDDMTNGKRSFNYAAMEQSNGFSILGGPPPDSNSLGVDGHVRDKDGTLAALLVAEIAAWAKENDTSIIEIIDEKIYKDPEIGLFVNHYDQDPTDGEYPGIEGDRKKIGILRRALGCLQLAKAGDLEFGGMQVTDSVSYRTGKYDAIYPPSYDFRFPDEGVRFYFGNKLNYTTVRPSGTQNALRFYTQLHEPNPGTGSEFTENKRRLRTQADKIAKDLKKLLKAES